MKKKEILLNLGSGVHLYSGFINIDKYFSLADLQNGVKTKEGMYKNTIIEKDAEFVQADVCALPFEDDYADYIECIDVIEHLPVLQVAKALKEMNRVLKPGGKLVLFTNDFDSMAQMWLDHITDKDFTMEQYYELSEVIYGNQQGPGEFHTSPFNPKILYLILTAVGFEPKKITMTIYPQGTTEMPKFRGQKWSVNYGMRTGMIYVDITK